MRLEVRQCPYIRPLLDDEGALFATELAEALRSNAQLQELTLGGIDLWRNVAVGNAIVAALSGVGRSRTRSSAQAHAWDSDLNTPLSKYQRLSWKGGRAVVCPRAK